MMRSNRDRVFITRLVTIAMAASGAVAGYLLGCVLALKLAEYGLDQYAKLMIVQTDASSVEGRSLLDTLKASPYPACSDAEITYFREVVFRSEYLKDAGRILDGKIACSANEGRAARAIGQLKGNTPQKDGTIAYSNLFPVKDSGVKRPGLQLGTAYVVFGSTAPASLGAMPMNLLTTNKSDAGKGDAGRQSGDPVAGDSAGTAAEKGLNLTAEGAVRLGDTLYVTRCSTLHPTCMTASTTVSEALSREKATVAASVFFGGVAGALLAIFFSMMHRRSTNIEQKLRRAIARDQLDVVYQPIVNLITGKVVGAEALTRWVDDQGEDVSADLFIRVAEEHGMISDITRMVIKRTLRAFADMLINNPGFRISINVAAADLTDPEFLPMLQDSLARAKVKAKSLVIEITERSTTTGMQAMDTIRELRRRGHSIHIDDFGTGHSNLDKLLYLWADTIKIDKAFTRVIGTEAVTVAILPQILEMARSLNLDVVVEGVETERQASYFFEPDRLRLYGQGWLYGRPVPAEQFHAQMGVDKSTAPIEMEAALVRSGSSTRSKPLAGPVQAFSRAYRPERR
jgi:sensor c-di-GMP phosphodiesterase-like protein